MKNFGRGFRSLYYLRRVKGFYYFFFLGILFLEQNIQFLHLDFGCRFQLLLFRYPSERIFILCTIFH